MCIVNIALEDIGDLGFSPKVWENLTEYVVCCPRHSAYYLILYTSLLSLRVLLLNRTDDEMKVPKD